MYTCRGLTTLRHMIAKLVGLHEMEFQRVRYSDYFRGFHVRCGTSDTNGSILNKELLKHKFEATSTSTRHN